MGLIDVCGVGFECCWDGVVWTYIGLEHEGGLWICLYCRCDTYGVW